MSTVLRPLLAEDAGAAVQVSLASFSDLDRRTGEEPERLTPAERVGAEARIRHLLATDPGGAWVAEEDGLLTGVGLAFVREGLWGLSLLVVDPERQGRGTGRALLDACLAHAHGADGGLILASSDFRALRAYHRAGFAVEPTYRARGRIRPEGLPAPPDGLAAAVREGTPDDLELTARVDRAVRGAAHGPDWAHVIEGAADRLLVVPGRGYAIGRDNRVYAVAALDDEAAAALLAAALREVDGAHDAEVMFMTAAQRWALSVCFAAGLAVTPYGSLCRRGEVGPLRPYLPSGAYL